MSIGDAAGPAVTVIIPSHNRARLLERVLDALERQSYPTHAMEIVICADGCRDNTIAMLQARRSLPLTVIELPGVGPSAARNAGVEAAQAPLLIFLDDDVEPTKECVAEHVAAHGAHGDAVILGPYPPLPVPSRNLFRQNIQNWWMGHFAALDNPGHRMRYTEVLTGNLSMAKTTWQSLGGLDPTLRAHEDYEFGIRLIEAGVPIVFAPKAMAFHYEHETMHIEGFIERARNEARADVKIAQMHPAVGYDLKVAKWRRTATWKSSLFDWLIFQAGRAGDRAAKGFAQLLPVLGRRGLRGKHEKLLSYLKTYWYIRGLDRFKSFAEWSAFARSIAPPTIGPAVTIDLRPGLEAAEAVLDRSRPDHVELVYGKRVIGRLPAAPGAEPWAGRHLRPYLAEHLGPAYLRAIAADGLVVSGRAEDLAKIDAGLARMSDHYQTRRSPWIWAEQFEQWRRVPQVRQEG